MVSAWAVEFRSDALKGLKKLNGPVAQRVLAKIKWLAENYDLVRHETLSAEFKGVFKLRIGDYRVIYSTEARVITIHLVGHRREIYSHR